MAFPSPWLAASANVQRTMHIGSIAVAGDAMTNYGNRYGITDRAAPIDYFRYQQEARAQLACSTSRAEHQNSRALLIGVLLEQAA